MERTIGDQGLDKFLRHVGTFHVLTINVCKICLRGANNFAFGRGWIGIRNEVEITAANNLYFCVLFC
jgi:hypothetical protein